MYFLVNRKEPSFKLVHLLLKSHNSCVRAANSDNNIPLHLLLTHPFPNFDVVKTLVDAYPQSLMLPSSFNKHLPLHLALCHYPPSIVTIKFLMEFDKEAVKVTEELDGMLPLNLAINLLHIAYTRLSVVRQSADNILSDLATLVKYPETNVKISSEDCDDDDIATALEALILRMLYIYQLSSEHRTNIGWLPLHYLVYMHSPPSLQLINQFIQSSPISMKSTAPHVSPPLRFDSTPTVYENSNPDDSSLPQLARDLTRLNLSDSQCSHFSPFSLAHDRGWQGIHSAFKKLSVKSLSEKLQVVLTRGITESAYGSPRLVTPLPKLKR